ncbi:Eukaryotic translation initiation factor 3 subunit K [Zea mays]|jgi:hypothetical protein|uniref:Eukaryotic translation initiation factor 3 subunit K n=1 Tax=Zea mays TaxID=4577 RepID=A0A1D6JQP2_MAIZE|nr:Eukaryotic translation initiation factor 3 subunit K [Zea mays]
MLEYILCSASLKICRKQTSLANVTDAEIPYRSCPVAFTFFGCIILSACLVYLSVSLFQQMEEQFKALIVLSHYLEVHTWSNLCSELKTSGESKANISILLKDC